MSLGVVLDQLGRVEEAEKLLRESFESSRQVQGPEHPSTLFIMNGLGALNIKLGRLDDADALLAPCIEAHRRLVGPNHADTLETQKLIDTVVSLRARAVEAKADAARGESKK